MLDPMVDAPAVGDPPRAITRNPHHHGAAQLGHPRRDHSDRHPAATRAVGGRPGWAAPPTVRGHSLADRSSAPTLVEVSKGAPTMICAAPPPPTTERTALRDDPLTRTRLLVVDDHPAV